MKNSNVMADDSEPEPLAPIPTPLGQRLRNLCVSVLPPLAFACSVAGAAVLWPRQIAPTVFASPTVSSRTSNDFQQRGSETNAPLVRLTPPLPVVPGLSGGAPEGGFDHGHQRAWL